MFTAKGLPSVVIGLLDELLCNGINPNMLALKIFYFRSINMLSQAANQIDLSVGQ